MDKWMLGIYFLPETQPKYIVFVVVCKNYSWYVCILYAVCVYCMIWITDTSEEPDLFTNVLLFISTVPAPQQASSSHHWPPTKTAFHSWSERFSAKLCPAWYPTPLLYPLTSTHSMPTSLEKERKFRAAFYWHDVCIYILVGIYLHISTQRPEYPLHTPFPVLMTSSEEQIFWERPRYPSKSYSKHTNT